MTLLVDEWKRLPDQKSLTFHLRPGSELGFEAARTRTGSLILKGLHGSLRIELGFV